jgi:hypothetical protein
MDKAAPERIFLQWTGSEHDEDNTWCADQIHDDDVEYIKLAAVGGLLMRALVWLERMSDELPGFAPMELLDELKQAAPEKKVYTLKAETGRFKGRIG